MSDYTSLICVAIFIIGFFGVVMPIAHILDRRQVKRVETACAIYLSDRYSSDERKRAKRWLDETGSVVFLYNDPSPFVSCPIVSSTAPKLLPPPRADR